MMSLPLDLDEYASRLRAGKSVDLSRLVAKIRDAERESTVGLYSLPTELKCMIVKACLANNGKTSTHYMTSARVLSMAVCSRAEYGVCVVLCTFSSDATISRAANEWRNACSRLRRAIKWMNQQEVGGVRELTQELPHDFSWALYVHDAHAKGNEWSSYELVMVRQNDELYDYTRLAFDVIFRTAQLHQPVFSEHICVLTRDFPQSPFDDTHWVLYPSIVTNRARPIWFVDKKPRRCRS